MTFKNPRLPYGRQWLDEDDLAAVRSALDSDWLTQGPEGEAFEKEFAAACGSDYAVAVGSGTAALHLACLVAGLKPGQTLITSPITFVASANCAIFCGAEVAFSDVGPHLPLLDPQTLDRTVRDLRQAGAEPRVVVPVHYAGLCCDMEAIAEVAQKHGLTVIEDACHALGAQWRDAKGDWHRVGSCSHSAMSIFSFHPVKHITTGEGGMITTNSPELALQLRRLRSHGLQKAPTTEESGDWFYAMYEVGFNYRLTDVASALGRSQLGKLERWVDRRRSIITSYVQAFAQHEWCSLLVEPPEQKASYHLAVLNLCRAGEKQAQTRDSSEETCRYLALRRRKLYDFMIGQRVGVQVHYIPVYRQPYYQQRYQFDRRSFPASERFYAGCLSLPLFPRMTQADIERVIALIAKAEFQA